MGESFGPPILQSSEHPSPKAWQTHPLWWSLLGRTDAKRRPGPGDSCSFGTGAGAAQEPRRRATGAAGRGHREASRGRGTGPLALAWSALEWMPLTY